MILDKAPEPVKVFLVDWVDDGYGGKSPRPSDTFVEVNAFVLPTGFAGSGWAAAMRYAAEGWADVARSTVVLPAVPKLADLSRWTRIEINGELWTTVQHPKRWRTRRIEYYTVLCELKGNGE